MCLRQETEAVLRRFGRLDYGGYVSGLRPLFADSDYVLANLETPVRPDAPLTEKAIRFNSPPALLEALRGAGFGFLSTANNHCLDAGVAGAEATLDSLDAAGLDHDGTYRTEEESGRVFVKEIGGIRLAILCFTFGTNSEHNGVMLPPGEEWRVALLKKQNRRRRTGFDPDAADAPRYTYIADDVSPAAISNPANRPYLDRAVEKVRRAAGRADIVIAMPHVGGQYNPSPAGYAKHIVGKMKEAGADLVIAGHPHVAQRCGRWDGSGPFAAYSLGNLCCTPGVGYYVPDVQAEYGVVLHAVIDGARGKPARFSFSVVKNVVTEDGLTRALPVADLFREERNPARRDRLAMENEAVVNRFRGGCDDVAPRAEYPFGSAHG